MQVARLHRRRITGLLAAAVVAALALVANANPNKGIVIVVDHPEHPELAILDLRVDNSGATHTPVEIRIAVPEQDDSNKVDDGGQAMRWAELRVYLTTVDDPEARRLSEITLELDGRWTNRSIVVDVPSPGSGDYYVHVEGELRLADHSTVDLSASGLKRISFDDPQQCSGVTTVTLNLDRACPLLFGSKSSKLFDPKQSGLHADNKKALDDIVATIDDLCADGALQRVSVRGWASTRNSVNPTNEELGRDRASSVAEALRARVQDSCDAQIHSDTVAGVEAATMRFTQSGSATIEEKEQDNRCAQIEITRHSCSDVDGEE